MKIKELFLMLLAILVVGCKENPYDLDKPFGWAECCSPEGGTYDLTGGSKGKSIRLFSNGEAIDTVLIQALNDYDEVILDGSRGDFIIEKALNFTDLRDKSILGANGAVLKTKFQMDEDFLKVIVDAHLEGLSTDVNTGDTLSSGVYVTEQREYVQRQLLIDYTGDETESYREAGFFAFGNGVENIIIRNIKFEGPGALDIGGSSIIRISGATHIWIDHCSFIDAQRTHLGIGGTADYITVSWCDFSYTDKSFNHLFSTLIGGGDRSFGSRDHLRVTLACCRWGSRIDARVPMCRFGTIHVLNNLYEGNRHGPNPRKESKFLVEGCYFREGASAFCGYAMDVSTPEAYCYRDCISESDPIPEDKGSVDMPYDYPVIPTDLVPEIVGRFSGPRD